jgi:hypothetical protein
MSDPALDATLRTPGLDVLRRAFFLRSLPEFAWVSAQALGLGTSAPARLAVRGVAATPALVSGRLYHALQVVGLDNADSESIQLQASLDGVTYANLGSAIVASGFVQVTTGMYGYFKMNMGTAKTAMTIQYVGAGAVATIDITAANHLILTVDGVVDKDLDLTAAAYDTYAELGAYIDGLADYTCTVNTSGTTDASTSLTLLSAVDIKTGAVALKRGATVLLASMR